MDAGLLKIDDFVAERKSELLGLELARDVGTRERPVEDRNGTSKHTLHRLLGDALRVARPLDGDGARAADVRNDDGGTNVTSVAKLVVS